MPVFSHEYLERMTYHIYRAEGVPEDEARTVARLQVKSNLAGHDSHGVIHIPEYVERIHKGHIVPGAHFEVVDETPTTARINGNWGFGFVVTEKVMRMAIEKARTSNVAAMTIFYQSHIGRLGAYATMAAEEGMIGMITADSGAGPKSVAPFGGRESRLGTNPICMAMPSDLDGTVLLDMATSAVAGGKVSLARNRREQIPLGWVIDKDGNPTTDPADRSRGGAILPLGGDQGHKGFGLSFMVEALSGLLTGLGFGIDPQGKHNDGCFVAVFKVEAFRPLADFKREMKEFAEYIKDTPPAHGFSEVLYPGEFEWRNEQQRRREGIFVEDDTWEEIMTLIRQHDLEGVIGQP
jgi:LDH2 family malate/lactate/ureidoglycolate dehydrogenase